MVVYLEIGEELWEVIDFLGEPVQLGDSYLYTIKAERVQIIPL